MKRTVLAITLGTTLLVGCAPTIERRTAEGAPSRYEQFAQAPIERFNTFRIDSWTPVSRNQLVLWTGVNEAYLVSVWNSCHDLLYAERIHVSTTGNSVSRFEHVSVGRERCPIDEIRPIDVRRMKAARAADSAETATRTPTAPI